MSADVTVTAASRYPHLAAEDPEALHELITTVTRLVDSSQVAHIANNCPTAAALASSWKTSTKLCASCFDTSQTGEVASLDHVDELLGLARQLRICPTAQACAVALLRLFVRPDGQVGTSDLTKRARTSLIATLDVAVSQLPPESLPEATLAAAVDADVERAASAVAQVLWDRLPGSYMRAVGPIVDAAKDPDLSRPLAVTVEHTLGSYGDLLDRQVADTAGKVVDVLWQLPAVATLHAEPARMAQIAPVGRPNLPPHAKPPAPLVAAMPVLQFTDTLDVILAVVPKPLVAALQRIEGVRVIDAGPAQRDWVENGRPRPELAATLRHVAGAPRTRGATSDPTESAGLWAGLRTAVDALT